MKALIIILFVISVPLFALGNKEQLQIEYIDLGELKVQESRRNIFIISLPYVKPQGVNRIPIYPSISIILEKLFIDGKEVKGKRSFLSDKMFVDKLNFKEVSEEEKKYYMEMGWFIERNQNADNKIVRLVYTSDTGKNTGRREEYIIPFGSKEIFITYCIRIPMYNTYDWETNYKPPLDTELITVKWTLVWP